MGLSEHFFGAKNQPRRGVDLSSDLAEGRFREELERIRKEIEHADAVSYREDEGGGHFGTTDDIDALNRALGELMTHDPDLARDPDFARQIYAMQMRVVQIRMRRSRIGNPDASALRHEFKPKKRR